MVVDPLFIHLGLQESIRENLAVIYESSFGSEDFSVYGLISVTGSIDPAHYN